MDVEHGGIRLLLVEVDRSYHPRVDPRSIGRHRHERLRLRERDIVPERARDVRQTAFAGEDLRRNGRGRTRVHEGAGPEVVPGHPTVGFEHRRWRRRAVAGNSIERHAPRVFDREDQLVVVPERLADRRVGQAIAIQGLGDHGTLAAGPIDHDHAGVPRIVERTGHEVRGDAASVRRPGRSGVRALGRGQPLRVAPRRRHDVHVRRGRKIPVVVAGRHEGDQGAVGRPRGVQILEIARREPRRSVAVLEADDPHVMGPPDRPALLVEPVLESVDPARRTDAILEVVVTVVVTRGERETRIDPAPTREPSLPPAGRSAGGPRPARRPATRRAARGRCPARR